MIKDIAEIKSITITKHKIICDCCGKELNIVEESYDGYYFNQFKRKIQIRPILTSYSYNKDLCDSCYKKEIKKLDKMLKDFGFET